METARNGSSSHRLYSKRHSERLEELLSDDYISPKWKQLFWDKPFYEIPVLIYAEGGKFAKIQLMTEKQYQEWITPADEKPKKKKKKTDEEATSGETSTDTASEGVNNDPAAASKDNNTDLIANGKRSSSRQQEVQHSINLSQAQPYRWLRVTLTTPLPVEKLNGILDKVFRYTSQKLKQPEMTALWRKEYQARGVEHFHLLVFLPGTGEITEDELARFKSVFFSNWQKRILKACGKSPSHKAFSCSNIISRKELEKEFAYQRKEEKNAKALRRQMAAEGKKGKRWGVLNRGAYKALVEIKTIVLKNLHHFFVLKRNLYKTTNAKLRALNSKRRRRKFRFQVDSRFFFLNCREIEAALKASIRQTELPNPSPSAAQRRRQYLFGISPSGFKNNTTTSLRFSRSDHRKRSDFYYISL